MSNAQRWSLVVVNLAILACWAFILLGGYVRRHADIEVTAMLLFLLPCVNFYFAWATTETDDEERALRRQLRKAELRKRIAETTGAPAAPV